MSNVRFQQFAERAPQSVAVVDPSEQEWSRGALATLANQVSRALRRHGVVPGDVVAIVAPNCAEYMAIYLAATQIGVYLVPINCHLAPVEIAYIIEDSAAVALFAHERASRSIVATLATLHAKPRLLVSFGAIAGFRTLNDIVAGASGAPLEDHVAGRVLAYTSATTGRPKGVYLPLESAARHLDQAIERRIAGGVELERHVHLCASMLHLGAPLEWAAAALHMGH
jgi:long-chain acyl-CoA synthetase